MKQIAVIGSGISGLSCAWQLAKQHHVTLIESQPYLGGHTNTIDVTIDGITHPIDTGFLVFNERTYPLLIELFAQLNITTAPSDMSFSVRMDHADLEWSGSTLNSVFAQRKNLFRPQFWGMLRDIMRFNRHATQLANQHLNNRSTDQTMNQSLGDFLQQHHYGALFINAYLLPMAAAIWSCPMHTMRQFPIGSFIRFFHNHGLLQVTNRPQWFTVKNGARQYVHAIAKTIQQIHLNTQVTAIQRHADQVHLTLQHADDSTSNHTTQNFDALVLATHSDQALKLLGESATSDETALLGQIRYQPNTAIVHTDASVLPRNTSAWSAWNYQSQVAKPILHDRNATNHPIPTEPQVCVHYLINHLQPVPFKSPVMVSLNPITPIDLVKIIRTIDYHHPILDEAAVLAQPECQRLQGKQRTWFAGAWLGYGFHEDGLRSGLAASELILRQLASEPH